MLKEKLATPEATVQEIFNRFLHRHFTEDTLMLLDSNRAEIPHQQIMTIKRPWDYKNFHACRRMWRHDQCSTQQVSLWKHEGGYQKYNWRSGGSKDHTTQLPREGESPSNKAGAVVNFLAGNGMAKGIAS